MKKTDEGCPGGNAAKCLPAVTVTCRLVVMLGLVVTGHSVIRAQTSTNLFEALDLPLVSADSVPPIGTFFMLSTASANGLGPPWPFNPLEGQQTDIYWLGSNALGSASADSFLID